MPLQRRTLGRNAASDETSASVRRRHAWSTTPTFSCPSARSSSYERYSPSAVSFTLTIARSSSVTLPALRLAHEPPAGGAHERHRLGEEDAHHVSEGDR